MLKTYSVISKCALSTIGCACTLAACFLSIAIPAGADGIFLGDHEPSGPLDLIAGERSFDSASVRVALYNDDGTWRTGYNHLKMFLSEYQVSYETIDRADVRQGRLVLDSFDVLIMPGGASWTYLDTLEEEGANAIREFVESGGGYLGICAGAFYAMSHREGGYHTGEYGIGLVRGTAHDGTNLGTAPFIVGMLDFSVDYPGIPKQLRIVLLEGPSMLIDPKEAGSIDLRVVARFPEIDHPAMTLSRFGAGRVFLTGPHPEVEEHLTGWGSAYDDPESDWPLLYAMLEAVAE